MKPSDGVEVQNAEFWKTCCERGVLVCRIPRPFREHETCWLVQKTPTFVDRTMWDSSLTFDSDEEMIATVHEYFATGVEPRKKVNRMLDNRL
jgi:hypothetical protein